MDTIKTKTSADLNFTQIAWVVKDISVSLKYFKDTMGITNFSKVASSRAKDYNGTYYGKSSNGENLFSMAYSGGIFIEIIQPVSGNSIFKDFLDKNSAGGLQHFAYSIPVIKLDYIISEFSDKGFPVVSRFDTPWADIVFFDTYKEIGVMTEIMGITKEGEIAIQQMKN